VEAVKAFYRDWNYPGEVSPAAIVIVAELDGKMVGVVRLEPEEGEIVLRGMRVTEAVQRHGIGTLMLEAVDKYLGPTRCFCIAYSYLNEFYGRIGFREIQPDHTPRFLLERATRYRSQGMDVLVMMRGQGGWRVDPAL
jgi:N-acetylglutamate synthase-like GNAT family acetyltransferase